jgi:hypothetical protein
MGMNIKPAPLLTAAAAVVAIGAPSAGAVATTAATPSTGTFRGKTSQGQPISLSVSLSRARRSIGGKSAKLAFTCPGGYAGTFTISKLTPIRIRLGGFSGSWKGTSRLGRSVQGPVRRALREQEARLGHDPDHDHLSQPRCLQLRRRALSARHR